MVALACRTPPQGAGAVVVVVAGRHVALCELNTELDAWQHDTNTARRQANWQFTTSDARIKLRHLYPEHEETTGY